MSIILNIEPKAKPQGTYGRKNPVWQSYFDWRNRFIIELQDKRLRFEDLPNPFQIRCYTSKKFKKGHLAKPSSNKPDFDNYLKAFTDAWFGGFSIIDGCKYDDGAIIGGACFKIASPVDFIEVLPISFPDENELIQAIRKAELKII